MSLYDHLNVSVAIAASSAQCDPPIVKSVSCKSTRYVTVVISDANNPCILGLGTNNSVLLETQFPIRFILGKQSA